MASRLLASGALVSQLKRNRSFQYHSPAASRWRKSYLLNTLYCVWPFVASLITGLGSSA